MTNPSAAKGQSEMQQKQPSDSQKPVSYTMVEVAKHTDRSSCWTVIRGEVYDVTAAIDKHKGGPDKILSLCGKDGTSGFVGQHGGKEKPETALEQAKIGTLTK
jgi:cytochrome b involved in lipid metabolism